MQFKAFRNFGNRADFVVPHTCEAILGNGSPFAVGTDPEVRVDFIPRNNFTPQYMA